MNYNEAREYLREAQKKGSILGLTNIERLLNEFGNPQDELNILHIAGTNGKGSTSAYISSILINAGYTVGRYTSPAVFDYLEIFRINDKNIEESDYALIMNEISDAVIKMKAKGYEEPTAFEIETALAFVYFSKMKCDITIIETGMGGIYDATNIVKNTLISVITQISMDHMQFLGDTIEEIASNKAGIIKEDSVVVSGIQQSEVKQVLSNQAKKHHSRFIYVNAAKNSKYDESEGTTFDYVSINGVEFNGIHTKMLGTFQPYNIATAIESIIELRNKGFHITDEDIMKGIESARWHGRFEKISEKPDIYFDGGHNPGAALNIRDTIEIYFTNKRIIYIIGVLADKDYDSVLRITADLADEILTISPNNARGLDGRKLRKTALKYNSNVYYEDSVEKAVTRAKEDAGSDGVIIIFGSLSYLGEVKKLL